MKTARFASVVAQCGRPEIYLALMEPEKDRTLQAAIKAQRVMTVWQQSVGTKKDHGQVGFEAGAARQFLVFPRSLQAFADCTIVGIKYDLLSSQDVPQTKPLEAPKPAAPRKSEKPKPKPPAPEERETEVEKVVAFTPEPPRLENAEIAGLKREMRQAMVLLEEGKVVAAFNLLKQTVES